MKTKIAVLLGGDSSEREISFRSGTAMAQALPQERFDVAIFDVALASTHVKDARDSKKFQQIEWKQLVSVLCGGDFDVVLPVLHGGWGEDGTLQAILTASGIPFVGSRQRASAIAMDKLVCKSFVASQGICTPQSQLISPSSNIGQAARQWKTPVVIKPSAGGSSVALTILEDPTKSTFIEEFRAGVQAAFRDGSNALVEEKISGMEVTAAVIGQGENAESLPLIEIVPKSGQYDYEAKYEIGGSAHVIPPRLPENVQHNIQAAAKKVHLLLGCAGVSRSDFMVAENGDAYFLEINTVPGMTGTSLVPDAARAAGIEFPELVERLVNAALDAPDANSIR